MHREIEIMLPPAETDKLIGTLKEIDGVVGLAVHRGASILPKGDVLRLHALNRSADDILRAVAKMKRHGTVSISIADLTNLSHPDHQQAIDADTDDSLWEEIETGLRQTIRVTVNFLSLMALGGSIAAAGLFMDGPSQAIAFVCASIIAPGFEPMAKFPMGLVLRKWDIARRALASFLAGYAALMGAAALSFLVFRAAGHGSLPALTNNEEVLQLLRGELLGYWVSACAATAGVIMIASHRNEVIAGPLLGLALIPAAALVGTSVALWDPALIQSASQRFLIDVALITLASVIIMSLKQRFVHQRMPIE